MSVSSLKNLINWRINQFIINCSQLNCCTERWYTEQRPYARCRMRKPLYGNPASGLASGGVAFRPRRGLISYHQRNKKGKNHIYMFLFYIPDRVHIGLPRMPAKPTVAFSPFGDFRCAEYSCPPFLRKFPRKTTGFFVVERYRAQNLSSVICALFVSNIYCFEH